MAQKFDKLSKKLEQAFEESLGEDRVGLTQNLQPSQVTGKCPVCGKSDKLVPQSTGSIYCFRCDRPWAPKELLA